MMLDDFPDCQGQLVELGVKVPGILEKLVGLLLLLDFHTTDLN